MLYLMLSIIFQKKAKYTKYELMKNIKQGILKFSQMLFTYIHNWMQFSINKNAVQVGKNTSQSPFRAEKAWATSVWLVCSYRTEGKKKSSTVKSKYTVGVLYVTDETFSSLLSTHP